MKGLTIIAIFALALAMAAMAQTKGPVSGVLMDKACSADNNTTAKALKHGKDCAEMEDCVKSGYGVITSEGKFLEFDAAGNKQAVAFLKQFKGNTNIRVRVEGDVEGSTVRVKSIKAG